MALNSDRRREWIWGLALFFAVIVAYIPAYFAGFIWDDGMVATQNPAFFSGNGLWTIWTTKAADLCPLTLTTFWIEHALWRESPAPYHVVTVIMHAGAAVVLWRVLRRLQIPGAWFGAALWALHPVQVASVAWISEMKNTQSGLFYLLAVLFFLKSLDVRASQTRRRDYGLTFLFAALAMASKSSTVVLPVVLALCAWWIEGRWRWRTIASLWPLAVMAILPVLLTLWTQQPQRPEDLPWARSFPDRIAATGDVVWFYLGKLVFPYPLMMIYPRWQVDASDVLSWLALAALIVGMVVLWRYRRTWARGPFFAAAYFIAALLPVLGFIEGAYWQLSFVADHFQYLASMGPLVLAGAALDRLPVWLHRPGAKWQSIPAAVVVLLLAVLTCARTTVFTNPETLWTETLAWNPRCSVAENNLGEYYNEQNKIDAAFAHYQRAIEIDPHYSMGHLNVGTVFLKRGQAKEAQSEFNAALALDPQNYNAFYDLGVLLFRSGDIAAAAQNFRECLQINPAYSYAHTGLGSALRVMGRLDEAADQYNQALAIHPADAEAHNGIGIILANHGSFDGAIAQVQTAIALDPNNAEYHSNLGGIYLKQGRATEAVEPLQKALQLQPDLPDAQHNLAVAQSLLHPKP